MRLDQIVYLCADCKLDTANRIFRKGGIRTEDVINEAAERPRQFGAMS
jgi:hypothetical protein